MEMAGPPAWPPLGGPVLPIVLFCVFPFLSRLLFTSLFQVPLFSLSFSFSVALFACGLVVAAFVLQPEHLSAWICCPPSAGWAVGLSLRCVDQEQTRGPTRQEGGFPLIANASAVHRPSKLLSTPWTTTSSRTMSGHASRSPRPRASWRSTTFLSVPSTPLSLVVGTSASY